MLLFCLSLSLNGSFAWGYLTNAGISVERELERLRSEAHEYPLRHQQLASVRHYLHFVLRECEDLWNREVAKGITNYKTLLDEIERWRKKDACVCLVPFNYDRLLEQALPDYPVALAGQTPLFPALAIPVEQKADCECPADHLETLTQCLPRTTKLLMDQLLGTEYRLCFS